MANNGSKPGDWARAGNDQLSGAARSPTAEIVELSSSRRLMATLLYTDILVYCIPREEK